MLKTYFIASLFIYLAITAVQLLVLPQCVFCCYGNFLNINRHCKRVFFAKFCIIFTTFNTFLIILLLLSLNLKFVWCIQRLLLKLRAKDTALRPGLHPVFSFMDRQSMYECISNL